MKYPAYLNLYEDGKLEKIVESAFKLLEHCCICPHKCNVNRIKGEVGFCKTGLKPQVYSYMPHHGEEPPISGYNGSGTIFFAHCNMSCIYCQNYEFSQLGDGREVDFEELAEFMLSLQKLKCHNINLVSPTHIMPQILKAISIAVGKGLQLPIVYNTGGYELAHIIKMLDGIVDIYMPDMRYADDVIAQKYSNAEGYSKYNQDSIKEMQRQVAVTRINERGIMEKGLLIRHLVLPNNLSGTDQIMRFIATQISKDTYISLMSQYYPCHNAHNEKELSRRIYLEEYEKAKENMARHSLSNGWIQDGGGLMRFAGTNIKRNIE